jgi:hypothetical protein
MNPARVGILAGIVQIVLVVEAGYRIARVEAFDRPA